MKHNMTKSLLRLQGRHFYTVGSLLKAQLANSESQDGDKRPHFAAASLRETFDFCFSSRSLMNLSNFSFACLTSICSGRAASIFFCFIFLLCSSCLIRSQILIFISSSQSVTETPTTWLRVLFWKSTQQRSTLASFSRTSTTSSLAYLTATKRGVAPV